MMVLTEIDLGKVVGSDGKSAYEYAKEGGYSGTEEEFIAALGGVGDTEIYFFPYSTSFDIDDYNAITAAINAGKLPIMVETKNGHKRYYFYIGFGYLTTIQDGYGMTHSGYRFVRVGLDDSATYDCEDYDNPPKVKYFEQLVTPYEGTYRLLWDGTLAYADHTHTAEELGIETSSPDSLIKCVTVLATGWVDETETTALFRYRIEDARIPANHSAEVDFDVTDYTEEEASSLVRATNAGVLAATTCNEGYVDIYATSAPDTDLLVDIKLTEVKEV